MNISHLITAYGYQYDRVMQLARVPAVMQPVWPDLPACSLSQPLDEPGDQLDAVAAVPLTRGASEARGMAPDDPVPSGQGILRVRRLARLRRASSS